MPHDKHGNELKVGDIVYVPARVKVIELTEHYCNVTLETTERMPPHGQVTTLVLNSKQTVKGPIARTFQP
jgi:hypothetical protein